MVHARVPCGTGRRQGRGGWGGREGYVSGSKIWLHLKVLLNVRNVENVGIKRTLLQLLYLNHPWLIGAATAQYLSREKVNAKCPTLERERDKLMQFGETRVTSRRAPGIK